jgi:hypothetical protein
MSLHLQLNRAEALPMFPSANAGSVTQIPYFENAWRIGDDAVAMGLRTRS